MKTISFLFTLLIGFYSTAQIKTVGDFQNQVICNYFHTKPRKENIRTNIHAGNASLSCLRVKKIPLGINDINISPIKVKIQKKTGIICYSINTPPHNDDRRGHTHGGHSAISCLEMK